MVLRHTTKPLSSAAAVTWLQGQQQDPSVVDQPPLIQALKYVVMDMLLRRQDIRCQHAVEGAYTIKLTVYAAMASQSLRRHHAKTA